MIQAKLNQALRDSNAMLGKHAATLQMIVEALNKHVNDRRKGWQEVRSLLKKAQDHWDKQQSKNPV